MSEAYRGYAAWAAAALALSLSTACGPSQTEVAQPVQAESTTITPAEPDSPAHLFRGAVQAVDPVSRTLTVLNDNVEGWMTPMTMTYHADNDAVLDTLKVGDEITAKVRDGDFKTLYDVQIMSSERGTAPDVPK
jgi:Cu/Ag efflux protein CusF